MTDCVFCEIANYDPHNQVLKRYPETVIFEPLNPVTSGHLLVVPLVHVNNASEEPPITAVVMEDAAWYAGRLYDQYNIITSSGPNATQTVFHLHVHIVPRREGDGLLLPWSEVH